MKEVTERTLVPDTWYHEDLGGGMASGNENSSEGYWESTH